ncbi:MAG: exodeoxyribonuclease VII small subunit [Anaerolineae bacterium]|jgi:exodeoxyribonuclease VII small subunit|nr:exodeoxyribonuclease VII small subunit [Anaerolineae bacterium]
MARKEAAEASIESLSFEQAFHQLEDIVAQLERGDLPLDQSLELYARGRRLAERCTQLLDQAELQVREVKD